MVTIYQLKPAFQGLLRPITQVLAKNGVTANQVTLFTCLMSFGLGGWISQKSDHPTVLLWIPAFMFVRMALNAIDGMLAREHGMKSRLGGILNELTDVLSDAALYLPFAWIAGISPFLVVWVVVLSIVSEMAGVVSIAIGSSRRYDGPMGKSDRAFVFGLLALLIGLGVPVGFWVQIFLTLVLGLLCLTIWNRCSHALLEEQK